MSKKKRTTKPPVDTKKIAQRLDRARNQQLLVRIRRWIPDADRIDGYVVGVGARWVAVADLSNEMHLDGWTFIRLKDIQAVDLERDVECFPTRALRLRGQWPPTYPCPDAAVLDDVVSLITTVRDLSPLVTVHREFSRPDACWIGAVTAIASASSGCIRSIPMRNGVASLGGRSSTTSPGSSSLAPTRRRSRSWPGRVPRRSEQ